MCPQNLDNSTEIISIKLVNLNDNSERLLYERKASKCHFAKEFNFGDYKVQLRLDWSDIRDGYPTLDADIWSISSGKQLKNGPWHHTQKTIDPNTNTRIYGFRFKNLKLRLISKTTVGKKLTSSVTIVDSVTIVEQGPREN